MTSPTPRSLCTEYTCFHEWIRHNGTLYEFDHDFLRPLNTLHDEGPASLHYLFIETKIDCVNRYTLLDHMPLSLDERERDLTQMIIEKYVIDVRPRFPEEPLVKGAEDR